MSHMSLCLTMVLLPMTYHIFQHVPRPSYQGSVGDHVTPMPSTSWMLTKDWVLQGPMVNPYGKSWEIWDDKLGEWRVNGWYMTLLMDMGITWVISGIIILLCLQIRWRYVKGAQHWLVVVLICNTNCLTGLALWLWITNHHNPQFETIS